MSNPEWDNYSGVPSREDLEKSLASAETEIEDLNLKLLQVMDRFTHMIEIVDEARYIIEGVDYD